MESNSNTSSELDTSIITEKIPTTPILSDSDTVIPDITLRSNSWADDDNDDLESLYEQEEVKIVDDIPKNIKTVRQYPDTRINKIIQQVDVLITDKQLRTIVSKKLSCKIIYNRDSKTVGFMAYKHNNKQITDIFDRLIVSSGGGFVGYMPPANDTTTADIHEMHTKLSSSCIIHKIRDGTSFSLYFDTKWKIATCNGVDCGDLIYNKISYQQAINECLELYPGFKFESLDKNLCYIMGFKHELFHPYVDNKDSKTTEYIKSAWFIKSINLHSLKVNYTNTIGILTQELSSIETLTVDKKDDIYGHVVTLQSSLPNSKILIYPTILMTTIKYICYDDKYVNCIKNLFRYRRNIYKKDKQYYVRKIINIDRFAIAVINHILCKGTEIDIKESFPLLRQYKDIIDKVMRNIIIAAKYQILGKKSKDVSDEKCITLAATKLVELYNGNNISTTVDNNKLASNLLHIDMIQYYYLAILSFLNDKTTS